MSNVDDRQQDEHHAPEPMLEQLSGDATASPLWMVSQEPDLDGFVANVRAQLDGLRARAAAHGGDEALVFSRQHVHAARVAFAAMILKGERKLHRLCELLCRELFTAYQIHSVVFAEIDATRERFTLSQALGAQLLEQTSDLDLGTRQLGRLLFKVDGGTSGASLVANVVEYLPTEPNPARIHRLISRIKAEEELWNKVADEIFNLDGLIRRDKQISHLSFFIKDVFGLKLVVDADRDVGPLHERLQALRWSPDVLTGCGVAPSADTAALRFLETKDYRGKDGRKATGWEAIKSVVSWWDKTFEIQIQAYSRFFGEREFLTKESHAGFKSKREELRNRIAAELPLFGFCRDVLRWLFVDEAAGRPAPVFPGVTVAIRD